ncbi:MAG: tetratricopeptide repeat protein [Fidelibacterota bacterium]
MKPVNHSQLSPIWFLSVFFVCSCAYFNTFYNAQEYFQKAEKARLKNRGESLPKAAVDDYEKVIEKSQFVLDKYPETKLRKNALFLIAKAHFYRGEYRQAETTFRQLKNEFKDSVSDEVGYWLALIKWKLGKPQPAVDDLEAILENPIPNELKARSHSAIADVLLEIELNSEAMDHLEKAAVFSKERREKGQIYYRIAVISFNSQDYDRALEAYKLVTKYSLSKKEVQEASLKTVQIYRLQGDWDKTAGTIKSMLLDEDFTAIHGSLELELVKLYQLQNKHSAARVRLESIVQDYAKTPVSAEAFYLLGDYSLRTDWDFETAKKNYSRVGKEYPQSRFLELARTRMKEINAYQNAQEKVAELTTVNTEMIDSTVTDTAQSDKTPEFQNSLGKQLYTLVELEGLHFDQPDSAMAHLKQLLEQAPESELVPKALFTYNYLLEQAGDDSAVALIRKRLLTLYPNSEYSQALINQANQNLEVENPNSQLLREAEFSLLTDTTKALEKYRQVTVSDTVSDSGLLAAYFLGNYFDYEANQVDSASKYYQRILQYYNDTEQAKLAKKRLNVLSTLKNETDRISAE